MHLLLAVVGVVLCTSALAASDCKGSVAGFNYDLAPLDAFLQGKAANVTDSRGQEYMYKICGVVSEPKCRLPATPNSYPAVCQLDVSIGQRKYHDCGEQAQALFSKLEDGSASSGFRLTFLGGENGRTSHINFICAPGPGTFTFVSENPLKTYTFTWATQFACPLSSPPSRKCCLYQSTVDLQVFKTLCASSCPSLLPNLQYVNDWVVDNCNDCFLHRK